MNNGREALINALANPTATLEIRSAGTVSGFGGCNRDSATYAQSQRALSISAAVSTRITCVQPPGVMEQERALLQALQTASAYPLDGKHPELRRDEGAPAVSLISDQGQHGEQPCRDP